MSNRAKAVAGILGVLVLTGVALFFFLRYQIRKSFPETSGTLAVAALKNHVEVLRDEYGVPSIRAANEHDLFVALGYVHAQDRLWQMDLGRRAGMGTLSDIFGPGTLPFDKMFRIVGIRRIAEGVERSLTRESRDRLSWYADGVNAYIESHKGKFPIEFDLLRYTPEPWKPLHTLVISKLLAWVLNLSWWTDLTYGAIAERVGLEQALDIFPPYPPRVKPAVSAQNLRSWIEPARKFLHTSQAFASTFGYGGMPSGSNAWVVAPVKSATGKTILANDTHLPLVHPPPWYEMELQSPEYSVTGMSIPGVPGVFVGWNGHIAWGVTSVMADEADFYVERIDSADATRYMYDGKWLPLSVAEESVPVKGDTGVTLVIRATHHGPIITDIQTSATKAHPTVVASMRWTGDDTADNFEAIPMIGKAVTWEAFTGALRAYRGPSQNFVYGDSGGNIGYWCVARVPIRGKQSSLLPLPGWEKSSEWQGFVPFDQLPHLFNPPDGFVASANNKVVDDTYPYHISDLWEPPSRIERLRDVLGKQEAFSVEDFQRLQNDKFSLAAKEMLPFILAACEDNTLGIDEERAVFEYLHNWNFVFAKEDIATMIYQQFFIHLLKNIYNDEMGDDLYHDWLVVANIPMRVTTKLIEEGTSSWFDDVATDSIENRDQIIRKSMVDAISSLQKTLGPDIKRWRWGDVHTVTLRHPFGLRKPLDRIFDLGPYPYDGASTTLMSGEYSYDEPFAAVIGASFRFVVDFGQPHEMRSILSSGQSGQAFHYHFSDQTPLWLHGAYRTLRLRVLESGQYERLLLEPEQ